MGLGKRCILTTISATAFVACITLLYASVDNKVDTIQHENASQEKLSQKQEMLSDEECVPVCDTKECLTYAKFLLSNMKPKADPCENIHNFACGTYEEKFGKEESRSMHLDAEENMFRILGDILNNIQADPESASGKMKITYHSCMNYVSREKEALSAAQNFLSNIGIPDWPNLASDFIIDVVTTLANLKNYGETMFFMFVVPSSEFSYDYVPASPSNMLIRLDLRYFTQLLRKPNKASIVHILKYFDLTPGAIEDIWNDFINVRKIILQLEKENCKDREGDYVCPELLLEQDENCRYLRGSCSVLFVDGEEWFKTVATDECPPSNFTCPDPNHDPSSFCNIVDRYLNASGLSDRIKIENVEIERGDDHFVTQIIPTLKTLPDKVLANFLGLNFYMSHLEELNFYFQDTKDRYFRHKRCEGWKPRIGLSLWRVCTGWIVNNMHLAVQYEYLKKNLDLEEMDKILEAFNESRSELADAFPSQEWLLADIGEDLKQITNRQVINLVHLKEYQSRPKKYEFAINEYYKPFQPTTNNFFRNAVELRKTIDDIRWLSSGIDQHLLSLKFKSQALNFCDNILYNFGVLAPPFYLPRIPRLINLILLSTFMGHEIGHGIDTQLSRMRNMPETPQLYSLPESVLVAINKTKNWGNCLIKQFSDYKYEYINLTLNGSILIAENVADNFFGFLSGRLIDKYYVNATAGEQAILPGMNYSPRQVLYIAVSELLCGKSSHRQEELHQALEEGHSPWKFRSIGIMQNSKSFSDAFNCPEGSYMNPRDKCEFLE